MAPKTMLDLVLYILLTRSNTVTFSFDPDLYTLSQNSIAKCSAEN